MISAVLQFFSDLFTGMWAAFVNDINLFTQFLADILVAVLNLVVDLFGLLTQAALFVLPPVPDLPFVGAVPEILGAANYYVPFDTAFTLLSIIAGIYAGIWVYKLGKFMRGGG